jgi:hypothetical protein
MLDGEHVEADRASSGPRRPPAVHTVRSSEPLARSSRGRAAGAVDCGDGEVELGRLGGAEAQDVAGEQDGALGDDDAVLGAGVDADERADRRGRPELLLDLARRRLLDGLTEVDEAAGMDQRARPGSTRLTSQTAPASVRGMAQATGLGSKNAAWPRLGQWIERGKSTRASAPQRGQKPTSSSAGFEAGGHRDVG